MTYEKKLYTMLSGSEHPVYAEGTVPARSPFPYLTYTAARGSYGVPVSVRVRYYDRSGSFDGCDAFGGWLETLIPSDGLLSEEDGCAVWFSRGDILVRRTPDPSDRSLRIAEAEIRAVKLC